MNKTLLALYGLKWNPFSPELPAEALQTSARVDNFCWRVEHTLAREGGFALITGDPGTGKSVALRLLAGRLDQLRDLTVGAIAHPSSNLADFYREMGDLFGVELKPHNRWGGFKALRERWLAHLESTLLRPVLLIDEAQEMHPAVLNELRLLSSMQFDSRLLLSVVLAGDGRLSNKLRREELLPLGSRIRVRLHLEYAGREELMACLKHLCCCRCKSAGICRDSILAQRFLDGFLSSACVLLGRQFPPDFLGACRFWLFPGSDVAEPANGLTPLASWLS